MRELEPHKIIPKYYLDCRVETPVSTEISNQRSSKEIKDSNNSLKDIKCMEL